MHDHLQMINHFNYVEEHFNRELIKKYLEAILGQFNEKHPHGKFAKKTCKNDLLLKDQDC